VRLDSTAALFTAACLRVKPTKNNQAKGVRLAKDYVLGGKVKVAAVTG
jgi:hypothetical protein